MAAKDGDAPSAEDLQSQLKGLREVDEGKVAESKEAAPEDVDPDMVAALESLYNKHNGDLRAIFDELGENGRKAYKYPPADAREFAVKYFRGQYATIEREEEGK